MGQLPKTNTEKEDPSQDLISRNLTFIANWCTEKKLNCFWARDKLFYSHIIFHLLLENLTKKCSPADLQRNFEIENPIQNIVLKIKPRSRIIFFCIIRLYFLKNIERLENVSWNSSGKNFYWKLELLRLCCVSFVEFQDVSLVHM